MSKSALADMKAQKDELARQKKERELKMKEINKNFDRKDKRDTLRFLVKHGLTIDEAKRYTQLGMELKMEQISVDDKKMLETNFQAQLYAFRKLRERLLMTDNPANIYDIQKLSINEPIKSNRTARLQQAKTKLEELDIN